MSIKKVSTDKAPQAIGPYSQAVICGDTLYTSGQIAIDPSCGAITGKNIIEQAEQVMKNLGEVLKEAGTSFDNVIKTTCFLSDMADFADFNDVYGKYFTSKPARSCVGVSALPKGALCEVEVIALIK
ncbi:MAG: RidA family protein [Christensenellaceae bacterium]